MFNKLIQKIDGSIFFYIFLIIYSSFMLFLSQKLGIWQDEAYSLSTTSNSLKQVINLSYRFEGQPPVYFIVLALWRKINDGIFFARLISLLFTFCSAYILNKIICLNFKDIGSKWVISIFLINPFTVWASLEIRLYSFLILLAFVAIYLFYLIYFYNFKRLRAVLFVILVLGTYTQYYYVFFIFSLALILLFSKGWRPFLNFCLFSIPVAFAFLPNFYFIGEQYMMHNNTTIDYTIFSRIRFILATTPLGLVSGFANDVPWGRLFGWFFRIFLIPFFFASIYKLYIENKKQKFKNSINIFELFIPIITLIVIYLIVFSLTNLIYDIRYMSVAYPFYCLLFSAFGILKKNQYLTIYSIIIFYFIIVLINTYKPPYLKTDDNKSISLFAMNIEHNDEPILFSDKSIFLSFNRYYRGINKLYTLPQLEFDHNFFKDDLNDTIEFKQKIENIQGNSESSILITGNDLEFTHKKQLTNNLIDICLKNNYNISLDTIFFGKAEVNNLRIRRLQKK
jgi:hypothetical protein